MEDTKTSKEACKNKDSPFYTDAAQYWASVPPTVDGMLGGLSSISDIDLKGSQRFLNSIYQVGTALKIWLQLQCFDSVNLTTGCWTSW